MDVEGVLDDVAHLLDGKETPADESHLHRYTRQPVSLLCEPDACGAARDKARGARKRRRGELTTGIIIHWSELTRTMGKVKHQTDRKRDRWRE